MAAESMARTTRAANQQPQKSKGSHKLYHDLVGPVINITGFSAEIHSTLSQLHGLLQDNRQSVPTKLFSEMEHLIVNDLFPCICHLENSNNSLSSTLMNLPPTNEGDPNKRP